MNGVDLSRNILAQHAVTENLPCLLHQRESLGAALANSGLDTVRAARIDEDLARISARFRIG